VWSRRVVLAALLTGSEQEGWTTRLSDDELEVCWLFSLEMGLNGWIWGIDASLDGYLKVKSHQHSCYRRWRSPQWASYLSTLTITHRNVMAFTDQSFWCNFEAGLMEPRPGNSRGHGESGRGGKDSQAKLANQPTNHTQSIAK
jgi:hypothetical protein